MRTAWVAAFGLLVVGVYAVNSQVFAYVLKVPCADAPAEERANAPDISNLVLLVIVHAGSVLFAPVVWPCVRDAWEKEWRPGRRRLSCRIIWLAVLQLAQYQFWSMAATRIPVALLAGIFQSSIALVYVSSLYVFREPYSRVKMGAVLTSQLGVLLASLYASPGKPNCPEDPPQMHASEYPAGVLCAVTASALQAAYQVWFKVAFSNAEPAFVTAVWLATGVFNIFPVSLVVPLAHFTGVEHVRFSVNAATFVGILIAASLSAFVNAGSYQVIVAKSPTFWATCSQMAIPLSMVLDYCLHGLVPTAGQCGGYCLLVFAFLLLAELMPLPKAWRPEPLLGEDAHDEARDDARRVDACELSPVAKRHAGERCQADLARCGA